MDDRKLIEDILHNGQTQRFANIVQRYSGMVYSKALGIVHREEEAAEVTQQTFVKAYEQLAFWRGQELGPWLATIAMHTALQILDKERRRRGRPAEDMAETLPDDYDEGREEMIQRMERAIGELPEDDREIITLHYYEQRRTADIARQTGLSQPNVLVRLHRIREKLRRMLNHD